MSCFNLIIKHFFVFVFIYRLASGKFNQSTGFGGRLGDFTLDTLIPKRSSNEETDVDSKVLLPNATGRLILSGKGC